ncbi:MAG: DUF3822 family protein [Bacteroidota bacterium]|nr:DUF3822 family protein [Bacteroidota bacterium]
MNPILSTQPNTIHQLVLHQDIKDDTDEVYWLWQDDIMQLGWYSKALNKWLKLSQIEISSVKLESLFKSITDLHQIANTNNNVRHHLLIAHNQTQLVPEQLYDAEYRHTLFELNRPLPKSERLMMERIAKPASVLLFTMPQPLYWHLTSNIPQLQINHLHSLLIANQTYTNTEPEQSQLNLNLSTKSLMLTVWKDGELQLYNNYEVSSHEDVLYYIAMAIDVLELKDDGHNINIYGQWTEMNILILLLKEYYTQVSYSQFPVPNIVGSEDYQNLLMIHK